MEVAWQGTSGCGERGKASAGAVVKALHKSDFVGNGITSPAPQHDGARAIQFLRSKAGEWNLDPKRFAAFGGSAGTGISLWTGLHDDLADPKSSDPVFMIYNEPDEDLPAGVRPGQGIRHPRFARLLSEQMDRLGLPWAYRHTRDGKGGNPQRETLEFFKR